MLPHLHQSPQTPQAPMESIKDVVKSKCFLRRPCLVLYVTFTSVFSMLYSMSEQETRLFPHPDMTLRPS